MPEPHLPFDVRDGSSVAEIQQGLSSFTPRVESRDVIRSSLGEILWTEQHPTPRRMSEAGPHRAVCAVDRNLPGHDELGRDDGDELSLGRVWRRGGATRFSGLETGKPGLYRTSTQPAVIRT